MISIAACASETDSRPETADYIIEAILVPHCGRADCHSSSSDQHGYAFDSIGDAEAALTSSDRGHPLVVPGDPAGSELVTVLTDPSRVMPPDAPLAQADIDLISRWVADGAPGLP